MSEMQTVPSTLQFPWRISIVIDAHVNLAESMLQETSHRRPLSGGKVLAVSYLLISFGLAFLLSSGMHHFRTLDPAINLALGTMQTTQARTAMRAWQFPARVRQFMQPAITRATPRLEFSSFDQLEQFMDTSYEGNKHEIIKPDIPPELDDPSFDFKKMMLLTQILPFGLNQVYLKASQVHGQGVFASRNISAGEVVTFYPADIVVYGFTDQSIAYDLFQ
eukprot:gnl/TRDRNA2_/TRDRNA2_143398_c0_seq1.p1 gnl/TRDRNA2_/TRDRNA2_143398_c0~~gnl/TRDRNA2_/TRDRNA2_143398_c0_seq1.p1  ORF type:complete len:220 (-),score=17.47 gnl/TRDRNA2_/TRDRNA2_143398_c0_seq1:107-766(-)